MERNERKDAIIQLLKENKFMSVAELSLILYASPSSIRRDLNYLQNRGLLVRNHGGAVLMGEGTSVPTFEVRLKKNIVGKRRIAAKAARFLHDGQSVLLDASSTSLYMLPYIKEHNDMMVFSNNMKAVLEAAQMGIKAYCLGGEAFEGSTVLLGSITEKNVEMLYPDILFFSTQYLSDDGWLTDYLLDEVSLRQKFIKNAKKTVFLCDDEKIGKSALHKVCSIKEIDEAVFESEENSQKYANK